MSFNLDKCEIIWITMKQEPEIFAYKLLIINLKSTKSAMYFGVNITHDLSWNTHINQVITTRGPLWPSNAHHSTIALRELT